MGLKLQVLVPWNFSGISSCLSIAVISAAILVIASHRLSQHPNLDTIPTMRATNSGWHGSWLAGFKYLTNAIEAMQDGYDKYKSAPFKIFDRYCWMVIVSNRERIQEVLGAPDDVLSAAEGANDQFNIKYTLGSGVLDDPGLIRVIRSQLTRNIRTLYPEIRNEIATAFDEILDLKGEEWKSIPASSLVQKVVCRTNNRQFVGLPLCRDPDWINLNIEYGFSILKTGLILGMFPKFMRSLAARTFIGTARSAKRGQRLLGPAIKERQKYFNENGYKRAEIPDDLLSWFMTEVEVSKRTPKFLTDCILGVNFAAIHSSSNSLTHALFYLAAHPQYIQPLREEVETIVKKEGWSKAALAKMYKLDSFLKECLRLEGVSLIIARTAMKDFTFSDGTLLPKGTRIGAAIKCLHHQEKFYEEPEVFKPFRFAKIFEEEGVNHQLTRTSPEYLVFGHGKHACPGRFYAANVLKSTLAHIVVTYDVKLEDNVTLPRALHVSILIHPDSHAKVQFRKRVQ